MKPSIVSCAITGNHTTREHNPSLPLMGLSGDRMLDSWVFASKEQIV